MPSSARGRTAGACLYPSLFPYLCLCLCLCLCLRRRVDPEHPPSSRTDRSRAYFVSSCQVVPLSVSLKPPSVTFELSRAPYQRSLH
ncbi:hypothetical protein BJV78DRAFT_1267495 [Lactifluus subvellereus]|nr:hypothetical protein BJV78DRAFT_1267495 [Lactifluus subvellereus]